MIKMSLLIKDYRMVGVKNKMTLTSEFIMIIVYFVQTFCKIRHGFLSSTWKRQKLRILQEKP